MNKNFFRVMAVPAILACTMSLVSAAGMKVEPGLWETKSQVNSPGGTHENVSQDCFEESEISPEHMMDDNSGCEVLKSNSDAKSMHWTIQCVNEGVAMTGEGSAQSSGSSITGDMNIKTNFGGQEFTMTTNWQGRRIGACNK